MEENLPDGRAGKNDRRQRDEDAFASRGFEGAALTVSPP
jgi:hypothetical protein